MNRGAVLCARSGQSTPSGYSNLERMLKGIVTRGGHVLLCGSCMDARGIRSEEVVEGCHRSSLDELTAATMGADKVMVV